MRMRRTIMKTIIILGLAALVAALGLLAFPLNHSGDIKERTGAPMAGKLDKTDADWQKLLTPEQYRVTRKKGTEPAFTGEYWNTKDEGVYRCVCCGQPLFASDTKFDSGTGWPSFWKPVDDENVSLHEDRSWFMRRTEVTCSRCEAHLGHVFEDGPKPTGLRYCMNSAALKLERGAKPASEEGKP